MKYVILAAGKGTRMMPLTENIPKPLIQINHRPFLEHVLENLEKADPNYSDKKICIVVHYRKEQIQSWINEKHPTITLVDQPLPLGTGDAVRCARHFVGKDKFIMINGDDLYDPKDIRQLLEHSNDDMCYGIGYPNQDVTKYAAMVVNSSGFLTKIKEKPKPEELTPELRKALANANLWMFTPRVFDCLSVVPLSPRGEYEITDAAQMLADHKEMKIIRATGFWEKLGCPADIPIMEAFIRGHSK